MIPHAHEVDLGYIFVDTVSHRANGGVISHLTEQNEVTVMKFGKSSGLVQIVITGLKGYFNNMNQKVITAAADLHSE